MLWSLRPLYAGRPLSLWERGRGARSIPFAPGVDQRQHLVLGTDQDLERVAELVGADLPGQRGAPRRGLADEDGRRAGQTDALDREKPDRAGAGDEGGVAQTQGGLADAVERDGERLQHRRLGPAHVVGD